MAQALGYEDKSKDLANIEKVAHFLVEKLALEKIIITLGADGMGFIDTAAKSPSDFQVIPTLAQEVFDVSGAGDTAIATVVAALMAGANLTEAAWVGNCASGIVVGKRGTATCTQEELKKFYRDHFRQ
jgi:bifunctional ADP-heptose synthase (sugar kinase/adenylyltransferase)